MEYQWQSQSPVQGYEEKVSASDNVQSGEVVCKPQGGMKVYLD